MDNSIEFSQELAVSLYQSTEKFPVDLDQAWKWVGYREKRNALDTLKSMFEEDTDYVCLGTKSIPGGRSSHSYKLTVDCFKQLGMASKTEKGKEIRKYFLECEKIAKRITEPVDPILLEVLTNMQKEMKILSARTQRLDAIDKPTDTHKGLAGVVETEVMEIYPETLSYTVREYLSKKGVSEEHLHTMRKRAVMFANQGKQTKLPIRGNEYLFIGNDISYLDQALKTVLGLD